jgi:hypothetical protein
MQLLDAEEATALPEQPDEARLVAQRVELVDRAANGGQPVAILLWPDEHAHADVLRNNAQPRLYLLAPSAPPVALDDAFEDWVRLPATIADFRARLDRLRAAPARAPRPQLDGAGRLLYRDHWVALSPLEERLAALLVDRFEQVVRDADLFDAGWPGGSPRPNTLSCRITGLRTRVATLGLQVVGIRLAGYMLQPSPL